MESLERKDIGKSAGGKDRNEAMELRAGKKVKNYCQKNESQSSKRSHGMCSFDHASQALENAPDSTDV